MAVALGYSEMLGKGLPVPRLSMISMNAVTISLSCSWKDFLTRGDGLHIAEAAHLGPGMVQMQDDAHLIQDAGNVFHLYGEGVRLKFSLVESCLQDIAHIPDAWTRSNGKVSVQSWHSSTYCCQGHLHAKMHTDAMTPHPGSMPLLCCTWASIAVDSVYICSFRRLLSLVSHCCIRSTRVSFRSRYDMIQNEACCGETVCCAVSIEVNRLLTEVVLFLSTAGGRLT